MNCYICNRNYMDIIKHAKSKHPNFLPAFEFWKDAKEELVDGVCRYTPPCVLSPSDKKVEKLEWSDGFEEACESRKQWLEYKMGQHSIVKYIGEIHRSYYTPSAPLPTDYFGTYPESLVAIRLISPKFLTFNLVTHMFCEQCGGYGRKRHCPPSIEIADYYKKWVLKWKTAYVLIWQSDGRAGWSTRPDGLGFRRWGRGMRGVDNGLGVSTYYNLADITNRIIASGVKAYMSPPGPCKRCRRSPCVLPTSSPVVTACKGRCRHPLPGGAAPEGMGIDVMGLGWGLGIPMQLPVFDFLTKVGIIYTEDMLDTKDGKADIGEQNETHN